MCGDEPGPEKVEMPDITQTVPRSPVLEVVPLGQFLFEDWKRDSESQGPAADGETEAQHIPQ